jgi:tetratricopeptide (TPR) repeat protein
MSAAAILPDRSAIAAAEARFRDGAIADAAAILTPLAAAASPDPDAVRLLGLCKLRLGAAPEGLELLTRARALAPNSAWARLHHGLGLQAVGRYAEAAAAFRACLPLLPFDPAPPLNLATALLAQGDALGALRAARRAALRAPQMPQAHYTLGLARLACGAPASAAECFGRAVRLDRNFADAWVNLGIAQYRLGQVSRAKASMRAALRIVPYHRAATANLGGLLRLTGEAEAGERLLRAALAQAPDAPELRINLAAELLQDERTAEALALLDIPAPASSALRQQWLAQRAMAQLQSGDFAMARASLDVLGTPSPALFLPVQWRRVLLAMAERDMPAAVSHADTMAAALADFRAEAAVPEHRIMAHFDLAKFFAHVREPDRAFAGWTGGHRELARLQPFSRAGYGAFVDASIARFDRARLHDGARAPGHDPAPLFIVGMPRSGTTLCEQILSAHAQAFGAGERVALALAYGAIGRAFETAASVHRVADADADTLAVASSRYLAELHALAPDAARIVDKMPGNFRYLGFASMLLPGARVIACERDPRDIGFSIFTFRFYGEHPYAHDLADLGWYIAQQHRLMRHWRAALPVPMLTVRLADWVEDFPGTLRRVLDFAGLPYDPACERFYEQDRTVRTVSRAQVRQPVNARGIGRWRAYERQLAPLITELEAGGVELPPA